MSFKDSKFCKFLTGIKNVIVGEVNEIKELVPTEEDVATGDRIASVAVIALSSMGYATSENQRKAIAKAGAYVVADVKAGLIEPDKLIIGRIINEFKKD